ncbi:MAG: acyl--CoA ligase [Proteobacteria bacterium]|nr:acyl--CoA ligase [Pseudomonadota bacterium]
MNIAEPIVENVSGHSDRAILEIDGNLVDGVSFLSCIAARQNQLAEIGISAGDRVLVSNNRGGDFWIDMLAVWCQGAVYAPIDDTLPFDFAATQTEARAVLVSEGKTPQSSPPDLLYIYPPDPPAASARPEPVFREDADLSTVLFTSGSTGQPKAVGLSHRNVRSDALAILEVLDFAEDDRLYTGIPFRFANAHSYFVMTMLAGATFVGREGDFMPADLIQGLKDSKATCFGGPPIQVRWIAEAPRNSFAPLRWLMSSGDHLGESEITQMRKNRPETRVYTAYGLTELGGRFCCLPADMIDRHAGSVGRPIPGFQLRLLDSDHKPVTDGDVGEVYAAGPGLMIGYLDEEEENRSVLTEFGFRTGDLGHVDEFGLLRLVGRVDDVFKVFGQKVSGPKVREALMSSGFFRDAAVTSVQDRLLGTVPAAFVVMKPGVAFDNGRILKHLRQTLPAYMLPRRFCEIDTIPRTGSGKVKRGELKELAETKP